QDILCSTHLRKRFGGEKKTNLRKNYKSLTGIFSGQVRNSKRIHDDKYAANDHCFTLEFSP
ncbi:unnamed protein product, partial [Bubo scandiacus]